MLTAILQSGASPYAAAWRCEVSLAEALLVLATLPRMLQDRAVAQVATDGPAAADRGRAGRLAAFPAGQDGGPDTGLGHPQLTGQRNHGSVVGLADAAPKPVDRPRAHASLKAPRRQPTGYDGAGQQVVKVFGPSMVHGDASLG